jgi:outer membrane protein TolC
MSYSPLLLNIRRAVVLALVAAPAAGWAQQAAVVTLEDARARVRDESWSIQISEEQIAQTELLMDSARAVLLPNVSAGAAFTFNDIEVELAFPNPLQPIVPYLTEVRDQLNPELTDPSVFGAAAEPQVIQPRTQLTGNVVVTQTVYNARAFPLLRQARTSIEAAAMGLEQTAFQLERSVIDLYFAVVGLRRFLEISEQNVEVAGIALARAESALEVGVGNRFDVTRAQVELATAERSLVASQTGYQVALAQLGLLLNMDGPFDIAEPEELPADAIAMSAEVATFRPEVLATDLQIELGEHRIREQEVLWIPTFAIQALANIQPKTAFNPNLVRWNVALTADWQIYDAGLRRTERRRREYDVVMASLQRDQLIDQLETEIDTTRLRLEEAQTNVENAEAAVRLSQENLELLTEAQALGAVPAVDVILAQQQLFAAELALADSQVRVQQQVYTLRLLAAGR